MRCFMRLRVVSSDYDGRADSLIVRCHLGKVIEYDTVSNLSWPADVRTHAILNVIDKVLSQPWAAAEEVGREVPEPRVQDDCVVSRVSRMSSLRVQAVTHGPLFADRHRSASAGSLATSRALGREALS